MPRRNELLQDAGLYSSPVMPKEPRVLKATEGNSSSLLGPAEPQYPRLPRKPHLYSTGAALEAATGSEEDTPAASWGEISSGGGCSLEGMRREGLV